MKEKRFKSINEVSKLLDYWELPNRYILAKNIPKLDNGKIDTKTILKNIK